MSCKPRQLNKFLSFIGISLGGTLSFGAILAYRGDETFYSKALMPIVSKCREELKSDQLEKLRTNVFNLDFRNPVGVAAGFDKNSQAVFGLANYGLGFGEVGTVTPRPQDGNPKKRIFRVPNASALINRCGFNNKGLDFVHDTLVRVDSFAPLIVGINLGKNKDTPDISSDYLLGLEKSKDLRAVDYIAINISSPNTPGLRNSQQKENLGRLLDDVLTKVDKLSIKKPLLIKLAPDLTDAQIKDIADLVTKKQKGGAKVSGIILTNTTISRPPTGTGGSENSVYEETGGLSGAPLRDRSTEVISKFYTLTKGHIPIIGVGGISCGQDAYEKIKAGASLVQLYTSLTYQGPPVVNKIKRELVELLERDNLSSIKDAVGLDHRK